MSTLSHACQALHTALLEGAPTETLLALSGVVSRQAAAADHELGKLRKRDAEKSTLRASLARYVAELAHEAAPHVAPVVALRPVDTQEPASTDAAEPPPLGDAGTHSVGAGTESAGGAA